MAEEQIMEAKEVAKFLHLHLFTIHKLAREGKLPAFKIGNDWRIRRSLPHPLLSTEGQGRQCHRIERTPPFGQENGRQQN